jgi:hypothetical protein
MMRIGQITTHSQKTGLGIWGEGIWETETVAPLLVVASSGVIQFFNI